MPLKIIAFASGVLKAKRKKKIYSPKQPKNVHKILHFTKIEK